MPLINLGTLVGDSEEAFQQLWPEDRARIKLRQQMVKEWTIHRSFVVIQGLTDPPIRRSASNNLLSKTMYCPVKPAGLPVMYSKESPCACVLHVYAIMDFFDISSMFEDVRRMNKRQVKYAFKHVFNVLSMKSNASCTNTLNLNSQLFYQGLNFAMIVSSALMIWKGLMVVTGSESPIVVVLR